MAEVIRLTVDLVLEEGPVRDILKALEKSGGMIAGFASSVAITESGVEIGKFKIDKHGFKVHRCAVPNDKCIACVEQAYELNQNLAGN